jgi:hypothetical protein
MREVPLRITLFHTTPTSCAANILRSGLEDTPYRDPIGVHLCDRPDRHFRARGLSPETVLAVDLPANEVTEQRLDPMQLPDCRDYVVPAGVIRAAGVVTVFDER